VVAANFSLTYACITNSEFPVHSIFTSHPQQNWSNITMAINSLLCYSSKHCMLLVSHCDFCKFDITSDWNPV